MMNSSRLLAFASVVALCACGGSAPAPTGLAGTSPAAPALTELSGTVVLSLTDLAPVSLQTQDGLIPLEGDGAVPMASVIGADVQVRGSWDANPALVVESFLVVAVKGLPAFDGIVESKSDGYALRLGDGTDHTLADAPADLIAYVGYRVWVTDSPDASTIQFGVIRGRRW